MREKERRRDEREHVLLCCGGLSRAREGRGMVWERERERREREEREREREAREREGEERKRGERQDE
jgi:hypothetical protein